MAAKYEIGFSALLMPEELPITTRLKVQDFRTHESGREQWHPDLLAAMDDLNVVIDAMADLRDVEPSLFQITFPQITLRDNAATIAAQERDRIGLDVQRQSGWKSDYEAFRRFRFMIEAQGVFVHQIAASVSEDWRGIAIFDERKIPIIIINTDEESPAARSFSLLHEYCHLLLRHSAISDERSRDDNETFCNAFAAHFLMPEREFRGAANAVGGGYRSYWTDGQLRKIGWVFKTSISAVAIHLQNLSLAPKTFYKTKWGEWKVREKKKRKSNSGPGYYVKMANRLGAQHISVVFEALDRGRLNQLDAYEMLDVQAANFDKLRAEILERRTVDGWGR